MLQTLQHPATWNHWYMCVPRWERRKLRGAGIGKHTPRRHEPWRDCQIESRKWCTSPRRNYYASTTKAANSQQTQAHKQIAWDWLSSNNDRVPLKVLFHSSLGFWTNNFLYFHPYLGKWFNLTYNFQMGWPPQTICWNGDRQLDSKFGW